MMLIYTGTGKGKTCACVGQAMRALGNNLTVAFVQFIKRDGVAGEQALLRTLLGSNFFAGGIGFFSQKNPEKMALHCKAARRTLEWAYDRQQNVDMLILDEILYALHFHLLSPEDLQPILSKAPALPCLILSGRYAPAWLMALADTVTEMNVVRHAHAAGAPPVKGIEY